MPTVDPPRPIRTLELRPSHLRELRSFRVVWADGESGAPALVPARSAPEMTARARAELLATFELMLAFGKLVPRVYVCDGKRVAITYAHARLLRALTPHWDDGDGPTVDTKRPYGYRSYYQYDMAEVLNIEPAGPPEDDTPATLTRAQEKKLSALHKQMRGAVRALLLHGKLRTGRYRRKKRGWGWERAP